MSTMPNLLSQQIVSWLLQAAGLIAARRNGGDALQGVSPSTVKSALSGKPVLRSWDPLVDELLLLLGLAPTSTQRAAVRSALRGWDQDVSRLDTRGLPPAELLPAVLRVLAPALGVRFGAWAALEQLRPSTPTRPVSEWLCDPLAPDAFGHVVDWLFVRHHPELAHWSERYPLLSGIDRTTVDDWRSPTLLRVPNAANLTVIAGAMGKEHAARALALLRMARVLAAARELVATVGGQLMADDFAAMIASYARTTRAALTAPGVVADVAEQMYATLLETPAGASFVANLAPVAGWRVDDSPVDLAQQVREAARHVRESGDLTELRWLLAATLVEPMPLLVGGVSTHLGNTAGMQRALTPVLELVQMEWRFHHVLWMLARGVPLAWSRTEPAPDRLQPPSEIVQAMARMALDEQRRLVRREGDPAPEPFLQERLFMTLATQSGGDDALRETVAALNASSKLAFAPRFMEPALEDAQLAELPHLMAARARSLALRGEDSEAFDWIGRWAKSDAPRSSEERRAVADSTIAIAHRLVERGRPMREFLNLELPIPFDELPNELQASVRKGVETSRRTLSSLLTTGDRLLEIATGVDQAHSGTPEEVERLVRLFPLALRLDLLAADATGDEAFLTRSETLAERLGAADRALPDHGPAWAMRAVWHLVLGEDPSLALKHATHLGSLALYEAEVARLVADHALAQSTR